MNELPKFLWTLVGVLFAGAMGYVVAAYAISDLNKRVLDAASELGRVKAQTEQILKENEELTRRTEELTQKTKDLNGRRAKIESEIAATESKLRSAVQSNPGKLIDAINLLNQSPETRQLAEQIQKIESNYVSQCKMQLEAIWGNCAPNQKGNRMPVVGTSLTPLKGGWSEWSPWQIASEWDSAPWGCIRARLYCK